MRTWVDAATLIALDAIGQSSLLRDLLGRVSVTTDVASEVFTGRESEALGRARGDWIEIVSVRGDRKRWLALGLGKGEASLLSTPSEDRLVIDEVPARTAAESEGRTYVGLLGLLIEGARGRRIPAERAKDVLQRLGRGGFRITSELYDEAMRELESLGR